MSKTIKVQKGEGPWQVARRAGISLDELYRLNPKAKKMIHPNQELVVNDGTTTTATVKKGEGPWQVAQRMGVSLEDVYKYNPKARKMIYPGDKLTIPIKQGTKKDTDSNKTNKTISTPVEGNAQSASKDTTRTQVAPKDTVRTNKPSNKTNNTKVSKPKKDTIYNAETLPEVEIAGTKPKKDLETTVRQWQARKKNPDRSYRSVYDTYAPAVGPRKVSQTRRLDAIHDIGTAIDVDPRLLSGKGIPYTAPPVISKNNPIGALGASELQGFAGSILPNPLYLRTDVPTIQNVAVPGMYETMSQEYPIIMPALTTTYLRTYRNGGSLARRRLESAGVLSI